MVLLDGAAATEERDEEDDTADSDEEGGSAEEVVAEKVEVVGVGALDDSAGADEEQAGEGEKEVEEEEAVLDALHVGLHSGGWRSRRAGEILAGLAEWWLGRRLQHCTGVKGWRMEAACGLRPCGLPHRQELQKSFDTIDIWPVLFQ